VRGVAACGGRLPSPEAAGAGCALRHLIRSVGRPATRRGADPRCGSASRRPASGASPRPCIARRSGRRSVARCRAPQRWRSVAPSADRAR
jgi:hypothetical protein